MPLRNDLIRPFAAVGVFGLIAVASYPALAAADPTGVWQVEDDIARVRIEKCGPQGADLCGYTVWLKQPLDPQGQPRRDTENTDPARKGQPVLGHQNLMGLKPTGDGGYEGKVYNVDNGRFYDATVTADADPSRLRLRGCMMGLLCASQTWKRVTDVLPGQITDPPSALKGAATGGKAAAPKLAKP